MEESVYVSPMVLMGLTHLQPTLAASHRVDARFVAAQALDAGYKATAHWVLRNPELLQRGLRTGFTVADQSQEQTD